ncbi:MAG: NAD(+) diphosphatase [Myxococcales bacterium]|nr:NAD(+) diphosphatase [Myxococcales bacterium]
MFEAKIALDAVGDEPSWFVFRGDELLVREDNPSSATPWRGALPRELAAREALTLGLLDGRPAFACVAPDDAVAPTGAVFSPLRPLHARLSASAFDAASLASQLVYFARHYRYCARCAQPLAPIENSRARVCTGCKHEWYPRVSPCAIVLVYDGDRVLMTRQPRYPAGMYGLVAGFVEPNESVEACATREAFEECGARLQNVRYFGSQPWSFPHQLMVGFVAEFAGGELVIDRGELEDARWFHRDALPLLPPPVSIARKMIDAWVRREL